MTTKVGKYKRYGRAIMALLVASVLLGSAPIVFAHGKATGVVKERMALMENLAKSMKALMAMIRGRAPYDAAAD